MADMEEKSFEEIASRLDEIVDAVRAKDTSLEHSLDLFDEAIKLGNAAVEMVDNIDFDAEATEEESGEAQENSDSEEGQSAESVEALSEGSGAESVSVASDASGSENLG